MDRNETARLRTIYDGLAPTWHATHGDRNLLHDSALRLKALLSPHDRILDIGCATGRDVALWRSLGHECVGVDLSPAMVAEAARIQPDAQFVVGDIAHLDRLALGRFQAFWAAALFLHVPKANIGDALAQLSNVLVLAGVGYIITKEGDGESRDTQGRLISLWRGDELFATLTTNHYQVLSRRSVPDALGRTDVSWLEFMVMAVNG